MSLPSKNLSEMLPTVLRLDWTRGAQVGTAPPRGAGPLLACTVRGEVSREELVVGRKDTHKASRYHLWPQLPSTIRLAPTHVSVLVSYTHLAFLLHLSQSSFSSLKFWCFCEERSMYRTRPPVLLPAALPQIPSRSQHAYLAAPRGSRGILLYTWHICTNLEPVTLSPQSPNRATKQI